MSLQWQYLNIIIVSVNSFGKSFLHLSLALSVLHSFILHIISIQKKLGWLFSSLYKIKCLLCISSQLFSKRNMKNENSTWNYWQLFECRYVILDRNYMPNDSNVCSMQWTGEMFTFWNWWTLIMLIKLWKWFLNDSLWEEAQNENHNNFFSFLKFIFTSKMIWISWKHTESIHWWQHRLNICHWAYSRYSSWNHTDVNNGLE